MFWDNYFVKVFAIDMGIQWAAWGVAACLQTEKFYDITGKQFLTIHHYLGVNLFFVDYIRLCNLHCPVLFEPKMEQRYNTTIDTNQHGNDLGWSLGFIPFDKNHEGW